MTSPSAPAPIANREVPLLPGGHGLLDRLFAVAHDQTDPCLRAAMDEAIHAALRCLMPDPCLRLSIPERTAYEHLVALNGDRFGGVLADMPAQGDDGFDVWLAECVEEHMDDDAAWKGWDRLLNAGEVGSARLHEMLAWARDGVIREMAADAPKPGEPHTL